MVSRRLKEQMQFVLEIDKLKSVLRRTGLIDGSRRENSAEHSWHLAMMAVTLAEHANEAVDVLHVVKMLLIHDIVEIDADDTFCYDVEGMADKEEREQAAAERIFGLLPEDQARELRRLWDEFEAMETPESRFANALDRLQPVLSNYHCGGGTWREYGVTEDQVWERLRPIAAGSRALWEYVSDLVKEAVRTGAISRSASRD